MRLPLFDRLGAGKIRERGHSLAGDGDRVPLSVHDYVPGRDRDRYRLRRAQGGAAVPELRDEKIRRRQDRPDGEERALLHVRRRQDNQSEKMLSGILVAAVRRRGRAVLRVRAQLRKHLVLGIHSLAERFRLAPRRSRCRPGRRRNGSPAVPVSHSAAPLEQAFHTCRADPRDGDGQTAVAHREPDGRKASLREPDGRTYQAGHSEDVPPVLRSDRSLRLHKADG